MEKSKKVKGSALYLEDGGLIFTPYNSAPGNSPWKKVVVSLNGKMRASTEVVQLTITVKKDGNAHKNFMRNFSELIVQLNKLL